MSAWDEGRPIFKGLPIYGWQDNEVVDQITSAYDQVLVEFKEAIASFPQNYIDPQTARADALDWLAQLMGYTGEYWDAGWDEAVKRELIQEAQRIVWYYKGTQYLLQWLLDLFELSQYVQIKPLGAWQVGITPIGSAIGGPLLIYSLSIGNDSTPGYVKGSAQWRLVERLNRLYMPCWCAPNTLNGSFLHYHRFRVGMSEVGEPI